jgi:nitroreductase
MEFYEVLQSRRSVRQYKNQKVDRKVLEKLIDSARIAPSGVNRQEWKFVVVDDEDLKGKIAEACDYGKFIAQASVCIAVCSHTGAVTPVEDCAAACENIMLSAVAEGLGTCWVGSRNNKHTETVEALIRCPQGWELMALLAVGVPQEALPPRADKKRLEDVLVWNGQW